MDHFRSNDAVLVNYLITSNPFPCFLPQEVRVAIKDTVVGVDNPDLWNLYNQWVRTGEKECTWRGDFCSRHSVW